jgi:dolichyl-phosphate beta-glucosyltransferase
MSRNRSRLSIIVPCYNEANRLPRSEFIAFAQSHADHLQFVFVNDGSTDTTALVLEGMVSEAPTSMRVVALPNNRGKAEAVRAGLQNAIDDGATEVAYLDADLATPLQEVLRLLEIFRSRNAHVAIGSRIALHGYAIERTAARHYTGRVFATLASLVLRWRAYDTQCGAKLFRVNPTLSWALNDPFASRWGFDIELLGRLTIGSPEVPPVPFSHIIEIPLEKWIDVPGSKIGFGSMVKTVAELAVIHADLQKRRALLKSQK